MLSVSDEDRTEYISCVLLDIAQDSEKSGGLRCALEELQERCRANVGIQFDEPLLLAATDLLVDFDLAEVISSGHSRPYFFISPNVFNQTLLTGWNGVGVSMRLDDGYPILAAYKKLGSSWLYENVRAAFASAIAAAEARTDQVLGALSGDARLSSDFYLDNGAIPASDRVVRLTDNQDAVAEIKGAAGDLRQKLRRGNDLGDLSIEQAEAAATEIDSLFEVFSGVYVRPEEVQERARRTLSWIADKAGGALVGTAALALLALIIAFFQRVL